MALTTPTAVTTHLTTENAQYASTFTSSALALPPSKHYLLLTCMDARIDPGRAFGIELGDAHVVRNAGASARDALRSIVISQQLLQTTEIVLVKHTDCGMLTFTEAEGAALVEERLGAEAVAEVRRGGQGDWVLGPFDNLEQAVRDDVAFLKGSKAVPDSVRVSGWVYDVKSGGVRQVV